MTEWEDLFEMSKRWPDIRKPKEHILDTEGPRIGIVRGKFMHWLEEAERIGDEMNEKLKAIEKQVIVPQLKDSKEYLDTHEKPDPHDVEMSRYWLEKGIYGTVAEIDKILQSYVKQ